MEPFEKENFWVVPVGENKKPLVKWSDPKTWVQWEERDNYDELGIPRYSGVIHDWAVIPSQALLREGKEGVFSHFVVDIDNHGDPEGFRRALEWVRQSDLPKTLTIITPSGGLHLYYHTPHGDIPKNTDLRKIDLPIEIKSAQYVVAPNGRDRRPAYENTEIAFYNLTEGSSIYESTDGLRRRRAVPIKKMPIDPSFDVERFRKHFRVGTRHNGGLGMVIALRDAGCPYEKIVQWYEENIWATYSEKEKRLRKNEFENYMNWYPS